MQPNIVSDAGNRATATFARPADATAYTIGDHIANSGTGALVTPMVFSLPRGYGHIQGAQCIVTPASASLVITALDFDLLLFRPNTNIPFAAAGFPADNAALTLTQTIYKDLVCAIRFVNTAWRNPLGALTAGATGFQQVGLSTRLPFNMEDISGNTLVGVVQAAAAWTPLGVVNTFDFTLQLS